MSATGPDPSHGPESDARERAARVGELMWAADAASRELGMRLDDIGPGTARCSLTVEASHANGLGTCHGGILFALADSAFAFACNGHGPRAVAQRCSIDFVSPARVGDALVASARERHAAGRSGIYDVEVRRADGTTVALFRGNSRTVSGHHLEEPVP